ncbi:peptidase S8/S53 domain-containing protein [Lactarius pseudohatsudake]|nr:peptidase S8/S53 domain-containing protein [Lactarius pseudohatsudake]
MLVLINSWLEHHGLSSSISTTHGSGWLVVTGVPCPKLTRACRDSSGGVLFVPNFPASSLPNFPTFLQHIGGQYAGSYNPGGRGIPDISAQALNFMIVVAHQDILADGTSCAAPTVAGIISLLNDFLLSKGWSPLGFLNLWLYDPDHGLGGFNDITSGSNQGCGTDGFSAINGWDPVRLAKLASLFIFGVD